MMNRVLSDSQYAMYKAKVVEYERIQLIKGKSVCPFCHGSKTAPFTGRGSQDCNTCDKDGLVTNRYLASVDLHDCIN